MRYVNCIVVFCVLFFFIPIAAFAGSLDDPGAPTSAASAMYTLEDIYNRLSAGTAGTKRTGAFIEPSSGPTAGTGHTTDDIMGKAPSVDDTNGAGAADVATGKKFWGLKSEEWGLKTGTGTILTDPAPVAKTGQTTSYATGDDGNLEKGVTWPSPRFTDNSNGTVTDNLTGLIWLKNGNVPAATRTWTQALSDVAQLNTDGTMNGNSAGDTSGSGGSHQTDWRLPNVKEFLSLIDWPYYDPALSNAAGTAQWTSGDAFMVPPSGGFWSSTTHALSTGNAWMVYLGNGDVEYRGKTSSLYVWPVRGGP